ncbi:hypothetical protein HMPREF9124_1930 [Oribacterium sp. oral taxon 108 str. F0425]|nr:hypothetical protein HMPREF9124_1930 [Oribacterium sp. oral taxon 108 str. F0425]
MNIIDCFITEYKKTAKLFPGRPLTVQSHYKQKKLMSKFFMILYSKAGEFFLFFSYILCGFIR